MNRIQLGPPPTDTSPQNSANIQQAQLQRATHGHTPHALFAPLHYESGYSYPLLVWLHGPGDDERQLQRIMPLVSMRNYVAVGPRGSCEDECVSMGYCWRQSASDIAIAEQRALDCIDIASEKFNIAPDRVFIGGFDCGGTMAFRIGMRHPDRFAGVLSIGGPFPTGLSPLVNLDQARQVPLFIAQGREAEKYTAEQTCDELRLFHSGGFAVTLRQYPCGDDLTTQMLHDMDVWVMERVTGVQMSESEDHTPLDELN